jgi:hypothetical protein
MDLENSEKLCNYLDQKLNLKNVQVIILKHRLNKNRIILDSFGNQKSLEQYYDLFQPMNNQVANTITDLIEPMVLDLAETIQFFMNDHNIKSNWIFGFTDSAILELEDIACFRNQVKSRI